jgi:hypothetical protein
MDFAVKALRLRGNEVQIYGSFILYLTCLVDFGSNILTQIWKPKGFDRDLESE